MTDDDMLFELFKVSLAGLAGNSPSEFYSNGRLVEEALNLAEEAKNEYICRENRGLLDG